MARDRADRVSAARRRASEHVSGFETTIMRMPEGVSFFDFKVGVHIFDILPYKVKKGKDVPGGNPYAEAGELFFERTIFVWRKIGAGEGKPYCALGQTFGKPDPIVDYKQKEAKNPNADQAYLKSLRPQEQQLFILRHKSTDGKQITDGEQLKIMRVSNFCFGKLLDSRVQNSTEDEGWDFFYMPDQDGMTLRVTIEEVPGDGFTFNKATAIDFLPRKEALPDRFINHGIDLDDLPIEVPYQKMQDIFLGLSVDKTDTSADASAGKKQEDKKDEVPFDSGKKQEEPAKREQKSSTVPTAESLGLKKAAEVMFEGKKWSIFKINADGTILTLIDDKDEMTKAEVTDVKLVEFKKEEPKTRFTAKERGLEKGMTIKHNNIRCNIFKISDDGFTLTLVTDDAEENLVKNVDVANVILLGDSKEKLEAAKQEKAEPKTETKTESKQESKEMVTAGKAADVDDPDWDSEWKS